jgi:hypothetical protein
MSNRSANPVQQSLEEGAAFDPIFFDIVRELAREGGMQDPVSDEEARCVLAHFLPPEPDSLPLPPEGTPECFAELQRRSQSPGPALSGQGVVTFLRSRADKPV